MTSVRYVTATVKYKLSSDADLHDTTNITQVLHQLGIRFTNGTTPWTPGSDGEPVGVALQDISYEFTEDTQP